MCQEEYSNLNVGGVDYNWTWPRTTGGYAVSVKCPNSVNIGYPPFDRLHYGNRSCHMSGLSIHWSKVEDISDCPSESIFQRARSHYNKKDFRAAIFSIGAIDTLDKLCEILKGEKMNKQDVLALCSIFKDLSDYNSWVKTADARWKYLKIFDSFNNELRRENFEG